MAAVSPRRLALVALALALCLDAARSVHARLAYRSPVEVWEPGPGEPERMAWPPGSDLPPGASLGERVFVRRCAVCHGTHGRGDGPASPSLQPKPRDLTGGELKYRSTPAGTPPAAEDLARTIRDGLPGSAMPYFRDLLSAEELAAVVGHVRDLAPQEGAPVGPIAVPPRPPADAGSATRGRALYVRACASCHGDDLRGGGWYEEQPGSRVRARDLTAPWTFRGGATPEALWLRITTGMLPGPMPSYGDALTPQDRWDLVAYVLSAARPAPGEPGSRLAGPGQDPDPARRGDYLAHAEMCGLCHTHIDRTGIYREAGFFLAGGMRVGAYPHGVFVSRNLTPDETGTGPLTREQIARVIREGRRPDRVLDPWGMPWFILHQLTPEDALAIATYLRSMPPVRNRIPPPLEYGYVETLVGKLLTPLPAAMPVGLSYADGDFGWRGEGEPRRGGLQALLVAAEWALAAVALALWLTARRADAPRPGRRRLRRALAAIGLLALALAAWVVIGLPQRIPPEPLAQAVAAGIPEPPRAATPERAALLDRGRYLFTVTSCSFCHGNDGSGGDKISWKPFGTLWARNITSDRETGIGAWSDAEVARAIRSGISRDGRPLHWQGMIWDLLSNLDEEDLRAVVAFVRTLPPVRNAIPLPRAPAADDCEVYTFFLRGALGEAGCR